jgi:hypothetical protein
MGRVCVPGTPALYTPLVTDCEKLEFVHDIHTLRIHLKPRRRQERMDWLRRHNPRIMALSSFHIVAAEL